MARPIILALILCSASAGLSACGGMNRAVTVAPQTMDDLARQTEPFRQGRSE